MSQNRNSQIGYRCAIVEFVDASRAVVVMFGQEMKMIALGRKEEAAFGKEKNRKQRRQMTANQLDEQKKKGENEYPSIDQSIRQSICLLIYFSEPFDDV
mmetsp:Transcript_47408/g.115653  ORF Transcript_47408/g.115653 Transcript_47408/m.115653 type:complete len:99 (-) Transcript_47408:46-342(-)